MKCARCAQELLSASLIVSVTPLVGQSRTVNICRICTRELIGAAGLRRIDDLIEKRGWVQTSVFELRDCATGAHQWKSRNGNETACRVCGRALSQATGAGEPLYNRPIGPAR